MPSVYDICPCDSGKKFKFCCYDLIKNEEKTPTLPKMAASWPLFACSIGKNWQEYGMTHVLIVRTMPHGLYLIGTYLIDTLCLGVKNTSFKINVNSRELQNIQEALNYAEDDRVTVSYQDARSLVLGSIKYAQSLGFPPHSDWEFSQVLMNPNEYFEDKFEFGREEKPLLIGDPESFEYLGNINQLKHIPRPQNNSNGCGLCGKTKKLTKTECCNRTICDDLDNYVPFSYARNSCSKNHEKYTLCAFHFNMNHAGNWQDCSPCRENFDKMELYIYSGTNEYNFEVLDNPPHYKPTHCDDCSKVIRVGREGYSIIKKKTLCMDCNPHDYNFLTQFSNKENQETR